MELNGLPDSGRRLLIKVSETKAKNKQKKKNNPQTHNTTEEYFINYTHAPNLVQTLPREKQGDSLDYKV